MSLRLAALVLGMCLVVGGAGAEAFAGVLRGRVVDETGAPVAWAVLESRDPTGGRGHSGLTREDGSFEIEVSADGVLLVRGAGYHPWSRAFSLADTARGLAIQLEPAPRPVAGAEVTAIGRDEYNAAPAVRGLARFRTVLFVDGVRVNSDREIGSSAGFVDPSTLGSVEIVRGPGSVLYGSDAIGGVVLIQSDDGVAKGAWAHAGWSSVNDAYQSAVGLAAPAGGGKISLQASRAHAGDYSLPGSAGPGDPETRLALNSGFERSTGRARFSSSRFEATAFYSLGENIGRPAQEEELFTVPREEHLILSTRWRRPDPEHSLEAGGYVHPTSWDAQVSEPRGSGVRAQERRYRSIDWGALFTTTSAREQGSWVAGIQADARSDVRIHRLLQDIDSTGAVVNEQLDRWVDGVSVGQAGVFVHGLRRAGIARWNAGARVDAAWREGSARDVRRLIPTGQAGVSADASEHLVLSANAATAFREPTVTELFFAGRRPAGYLEGNPELEPERSYQGDLGARWTQGALSVGLSGFGIVVDNYIGLRTRAVGQGGDPDTLVYDNTARAVLIGGAAEIAAAWPRMRVFGRAFADVVRASDQDGAPLADAHPLRGGLEVRWTPRPISAGLRWRASLAHERVGANERPVPGYGVLEVQAGSTLGPVILEVTGENLLDQEYYERADPVAYPGPGRGVGVAIRWNTVP